MIMPLHTCFINKNLDNQYLIISGHKRLIESVMVMSLSIKSSFCCSFRPFFWSSLSSDDSGVIRTLNKK